jgi:hypothetical protein
MPNALEERYHPRPIPLGRWLLGQTGREDAIGQLAQAAKADRQFPRDGDEQAISHRLNELQADGEMHAALEDAALEAVMF